jgi:hypothetical protein
MLWSISASILQLSQAAFGGLHPWKYQLFLAGFFISFLLG